MHLVLSLAGWLLELHLGKTEEEELEEELEDEDEDEDDLVVTTGSLVAGPESLGFIPPSRLDYEYEEEDFQE